MRQPIAVAYGMGVDSTAMLIGMHARNIRPDMILLADTGDEKPETYAYFPIMQAFLDKIGFPPIHVVRYRPVRATYNRLEENCLQNGTLPSLAFGRKACSLKFKVEPQNKRCREWVLATRAWGRGSKVMKLIGYDAGPKDSRRGHQLKDDKDYDYEYPLREWGWDREQCKDEIDAAGLLVPMKSACWHCPATQPAELVWLLNNHPDLFHRAIAMEDSAHAREGLKKIEGLWRKSTKKRPGSWRKFAEKEGFIKAVEELVPAFGSPTDPEVLNSFPTFEKETSLRSLKGK